MCHAPAILLRCVAVHGRLTSAFIRVLQISRLHLLWFNRVPLDRGLIWGATSTHMCIFFQGQPYDGSLLFAISDSQTNRVLTFPMEVPGGQYNMSVEGCTAACQKQQFRVAGIEYANECCTRFIVLLKCAFLS